MGEPIKVADYERLAEACELPLMIAAELSEAVGGDAPRWFQLYWSRDREFTRDLME